MTTWQELQKDIEVADSDEEFRDELRAITFGRLIRQHRLAAGISQTEFARRADMDQPNVSRLERGGVVPTVETLERVAAALGAHLVVGLVSEGVWQRSSELQRLEAEGELVQAGPKPTDADAFLEAGA